MCREKEGKGERREVSVEQGGVIRVWPIEGASERETA